MTPSRTLVNPTQSLASLHSAKRYVHVHTDKKDNQIFLINKEIHSGAVAKSNGLLIYGEIFAHFLICKEALPEASSYCMWLCNFFTLNFLIYEKNLIFFFYQCNIQA